ncbi:MAG: hypothetical protein WC628_02305 [Candidatus Omnitrophota bacterium]
MNDSISPEEKLLRLIRGQKKPEAPVEKKAAVLLTERALPQAASSGRVLSAIFPGKKNFTLPDKAKIAGGLFALSCAYLIFSFLWPFFSKDTVKLPKLTAQNTSEVVSSGQEEPKSFDYYLQGTRNRQIFKSAYTQAGEKPASAVNLDLAKDFGLVGIIAEENPQAIIEDKLRQRTYYVSKGQMIGEIQVDDILEGKIILNYRGQKYELYL